MPSESVRHLVKTLGAASLVGISSVIGSPIAGAMMTTVGGSIIDALAESGVDYLAANHPFRRQQPLNHDLQGALQSAYATAIKRLEKRWWDGPGNTLSKDEREPVKTFFELLRKDAGVTLSDEEMVDLLQTAANIRSGGEALDHIVEKQLRSYLHGHSERLVTFMSSKLVDEIALCFSEELKTNDRAWRAYQRLMNEGLQDALRQALAKQDQIARQHTQQIDQVLDELRKKNALLDSKPAEQRDPWGEAALDRVRADLAAKIEAEAERTRALVRAEHEQTRVEVAEGYAGLHEKLDEGFTLILTQLRKQTTSFTAAELLRSAALAGFQIWRVPRSRNPHFIGRDDILHQLVSEAAGRRRTPVINPILGLGGIGKSQLAAEVAYRRADDCTVVWWVRAQDTTTLVSDLAELAAALDLPKARAGKPDEAAAAARTWLESSDDAWLLIFDNAEQPETLESYLPTRGNGQILVTSRIHGWRYLATPLNLSLLSPEAATTFLLKRTGQDDADSAAALANELGRLPLALEHAGAFIDETRYPIARYLDLIRANAGQLLGARDDVTEVGAAITTVWHASIAAVAQASPSAYALLTLGAFLAPELIPLDLIGAHTDQMPEELASVFRDPTAATEAVRVLYRYSLVDVSDDRSISVHRLAQLAVRETLAPEDRRRWASIAVKSLESAFPFDSSRPVTWPPSDRLLPHVLAACGHAESEGTELATTSALLDRAAGLLQARGKFATAKAVLERAIASGLATYDPDHPFVATYRNNLGLVLQTLGDLDGAKALYDQALASGIATYGPDHPTVAIRRNNLGLVLQDLDDLAGAQREFELALASNLATYGPDHPTVAIRRSNLGLVLRALGDLDGAKALFEQALASNLATYGPDHPTVAIRRGNLGLVLRDLGDLTGAKALLEDAVDSGLATYGPDHPQVANRRSNLGLVLKDLGDFAGAKALYEQALESDLATFGPDHPAVGTRRTNLGSVLRKLGDLASARREFEQALTIYRQHDRKKRIANVEAWLRLVDEEGRTSS